MGGRPGLPSPAPVGCVNSISPANQRVHQRGPNLRTPQAAVLRSKGFAETLPLQSVSRISRGSRSCPCPAGTTPGGRACPSRRSRRQTPGLGRRPGHSRRSRCRARLSVNRGEGSPLVLEDPDRAHAWHRPTSCPGQRYKMLRLRALWMRRFGSNTSFARRRHGNDVTRNLRSKL